jgi:SAM-dependent methyltransferase
MPSEAVTSYEWWQQTGWAWYAEVRRRRLSDDVYDRQEEFLEEFFRREAERCVREEGRPLRVLEYGCGFGRHLRYLHGIEGLELHGCDQSAGMLEVAGALLFGRFPELKDRIVGVEPEGPLPYEDGWFDVVFTVSVLLHVPPQSVNGRVAELRRVARRMVLHLEPPSTPVSYLWDDAHNGCWLHDLLGAHLSAGPCALGADADAIDPRAIVYRAEPAPAPRVEMLLGGQRRSGLEAVREAMVAASLDYARRTYDQMRGLLKAQVTALSTALAEQVREAMDARREVHRLEAQLEHWLRMSRKPLFRAAGWFHVHPAAERVLTALVLPFIGARRLVLSLRGKRPAEEPERTPAPARPAQPEPKQEGDRADGY